MGDNRLPCLDLLKATPGILRGLMSEVSDEDARWKPAPDRFSIAEVLAHLAHSEGHCYRLRVNRFLGEERPELEPDDAQFHLHLYRNADPEDEFDQFEEQRDTNIEFLRGLPAAAGERVARHREVGDITIAQMLHEWALARFGAHPPDRGIGARAEVSARSRTAGKVLSAQAMTFRRDARTRLGNPAHGRKDKRPSTRVRRYIHAPRARVYEALLDARAIAKWKVPDAMTCDVLTFDPREGGSFRISLTYKRPAGTGKTTAHTDTYRGRFVKLVPNKQVVEVDEFETEDPAMRGEMTITITLADAGDGTELVAVHEGLPSGLSPSDNETGWMMALKKLAALLEAHQTR